MNEIFPVGYAKILPRKKPLVLTGGTSTPADMWPAALPPGAGCAPPPPPGPDMWQPPSTPGIKFLHFETSLWYFLQAYEIRE